MHDFEKDLEDGKEAEDLVLRYLQRTYPNARHADDRKSVNKLYDLYVPETGERWEVKRDRYAPANGRIAVEVSYKGEQSGPYTSTADYFCFVVGHTGYVVQTTKMFMAIAGKPITHVRTGAEVVLLDLAKVPWERTIDLR